METVTLAQESKEMEEKLQQLKESMTKEKEERGWVSAAVVLAKEEKGERERLQGGKGADLSGEVRMDVRQ